MAQKETEHDGRKVENKLRVRDRAKRATQTASERQAHFTAEKYVNEGKRNLRGERNEVAAGGETDRQLKLRGERLKITADKDQPARKVSC